MASEPAPHRYDSAGHYRITLVASNDHGCQDSAVSEEIVVHPRPRADLSISQQEGCSPLTVRLTDRSSGRGSLKREWHFTNGYVTSDPSPEMTFQPGTYGVKLIAENEHQCRDTLSRPDLIHVQDTIPPVPPRIDRVSVLSDTSVVIEWSDNGKDERKDFYLFGKTASANSFDTIALIERQKSRQYVVKGLDTRHEVYCYTIRAVDACGYWSAFEPGKAHCTVNVTARKQGRTEVEVDWTPYRGCDIGGYEVLRAKKGEQTFERIRTTSPNVRAITDTGALCSYGYTYRVRALDLWGRSLHSWSDTSAAVPQGLPDDAFRAPVVRSTVMNNEKVMTEWKPPLPGAGAVMVYKIYRSKDTSSAYTLHDVVPGHRTSYIDDQVNVQQQHYHYRIDVMNRCKVQTTGSVGNSILLQGEREGNAVRLKWSSYEEWDHGVDHYKIQKKNAAGEWETLQKAGGEEQETIIRE